MDLNNPLVRPRRTDISEGQAEQSRRRQSGERELRIPSKRRHPSGSPMAERRADEHHAEHDMQQHRADEEDTCLRKRPDPARADDQQQQADR